MRVAVVFSSPSTETSEYPNVWKKCPRGRELAPGKLLIEGKDWSIYAFDCRDTRYYNGCWALDALKEEIDKAIKDHLHPSVAVLIHGWDTDTKDLVKYCLANDLPSFICRDYTSSKGIFYKKYVVPFARNERIDDLFDRFWDKLIAGNPANDDYEGLSGEVQFLKHRFLNLRTFMSGRINQAQKNLDNTLLLTFQKSGIEKEVKRFCAIEPALIEQGIRGVARVHNALEDLTSTIDQTELPGREFVEKLDTAQACLEKATSIHLLFQKMEEETRGR